VEEEDRIEKGFVYKSSKLTMNNGLIFEITCLNEVKRKDLATSSQQFPSLVVIWW